MPKRKLLTGSKRPAILVKATPSGRYSLVLNNRQVCTLHGKLETWLVDESVELSGLKLQKVEHFERHLMYATLLDFFKNCTKLRFPGRAQQVTLNFSRAVLVALIMLNCDDDDQDIIILQYALLKCV